MSMRRETYHYDPLTIGCRGGWRRYERNPVIDHADGEYFDMCLFPLNEGRFRLYFSWRTRKAIGYCDGDGFTWSEPVECLQPRPENGWEEDVNRPAVIYRDGLYQMWYTAQKLGGEGVNNLGYNVIARCVSEDGIHWEDRRIVMRPEQEWEKPSLMCPSVLYDEARGIYRMWYSGGHYYEPDAIGYAESADGLEWKKREGPIYEAIYENLWERERTTACQVFIHKGWHYMFYIGFEDIHKARVCAARSRDGVTNWERHPLNPLISGGPFGEWDCEGAYKPYLLFDQENGRWIMWVNCRRGPIEQIGVMLHAGESLWPQEAARREG